MRSSRAVAAATGRRFKSCRPDCISIAVFHCYVLRSQKTGRRGICGKPSRYSIRKMIGKFFLAAASLLVIAASVFGQAAVSSSTNPQESATPQVSPAPPQNEATAPRIPSLDELDQAFKQSSLGKAADEARLHAQWRELSNRIINDRDLVEARASADRAKTDLEKRQQLRAYYTMFYDRMRAQAGSPELKSYIDTHKAQHLGLLAQNRVRPSPTPATTAAPIAPAATASPKPKALPPEPPLPQ
jgi:hypothetical protein